MRPLGQTVARLSAMRRNSIESMRLVDGAGRLAALTDFGANPGNLDAFYHAPEGLPPSAPLVVVLHGCTQNAAMYDRGSGWSELADRHGFALLFPQQSRANNPNLCFNWFSAADTRRARGEAASIARMVRHMVAKHDLDAARVYINGLSAGGAMTAAMLACYPEMFAGGAVIAGLPFAVAEGIPDALEAMRGQSLPSRAILADRISAAGPHDGPWPTLSVWHGTADFTVDNANATAIVDQWRDRIGLAEATAKVDQVDGHRRTSWRDAAGRVMVERYDVKGMGHGTPIAPGATPSCGKAAPHMLDSGICSTRQIASSWGLTERQAARPATVPSIEPVSATREPPAPPPRGIAGVIDDALRAAGLMR